MIKLLCTTNNYKHACTKCNVCSLIDSQNYADLKIIDTSSAYIKKEQLLDVKDAFISRSVYGGRQIYVIKDASKLNTSWLLKIGIMFWILFYLDVR